MGEWEEIKLRLWNMSQENPDDEMLSRYEVAATLRDPYLGIMFQRIRILSNRTQMIAKALAFVMKEIEEMKKKNGLEDNSSPKNS